MVLPKKLFDENIPDYTHRDDLGSLKDNQKYSQLSKDYLDIATLQDSREWLTEMWDVYEPYADRNFVSEIKKEGTFNQRSWELYLGYCLLTQDIPLEKIGSEGPDFMFESEGKKVWIEATAPGCGTVDPPDKKPDVQAGSLNYLAIHDREDHNRSKVLRILSGLHTKKDKYLDYCKKGIIKPEDIYITAINGYDFANDFACDSDFLLRRSFFGKGCEQLGLAPGQFSYEDKPTITRSDGKTLETDIFLTNKFNYISGVLFSPMNIINNYGKEIGKDITLVPNPHAKNKIPNDLFNFTNLLGKSC